MKATVTTDGITMTHSALSMSRAGMSSGMRRMSSMTMPQFSSRSRFLESSALVERGNAVSAIATSEDSSFFMSSFLAGAVAIIGTMRPNAQQRHGDLMCRYAVGHLGEKPA